MISNSHYTVKRILVLCLLLPCCLASFAQHPHSHGGAFYWAIVGGISALLCYIIYLLFGVLASFVVQICVKGRQRQHRTTSNKVEETHKIHETSSLKNDMKEQGKKSENAGILNGTVKSSQNYVDCIHCGMPIRKESIYCNYCGYKQTFKIDRYSKITRYFDTFLKKLIRFLLSLALCAVIGFIPGIITAEIYDNDFVNLCTLIPVCAYVLYRLVTYVYTLKKKSKIIFIISLSLFTIVIWSSSIWQSYKSKKEHIIAEKKQEEEYKKETEKQKPRIIRTFLGCSFGDNIDQFHKAIDKYFYDGKKHVDTTVDVSRNDVRKVCLRNVSYGEYVLKELTFYFYNGKMCMVKMNFQTDENENCFNLWTYNRLEKMLNAKYYTNSDGNNSHSYCDDHTNVRLWHSTIDMRDYMVTLTYYDNDSGYREHQEQGF